MTPPAYVTLADAEVIYATQSAVLVRQNGVETWLPRRMCQDGHALEHGDTDICVAHWVATREGLEF